jgi:DNA (cytosine-5)-methyltransferase 1
MLTVGSLFAGVGGFDLGLERAGMRTVWFCEEDPFCRRVLAKHWPGVPCYPDVRSLVADAGTGRRSEVVHEPLNHAKGRAANHKRESACDPQGRRHLSGVAAGACGVSGDDERLPVPVPHVDVLCGGFPCQDLSYAGKGAGIDGERSGLWSEYARLVRELRPRYVIVENVPALLTRGLGRVLADLAACGYDAEWDCIPASAVGAPHRRDRVWLVAYPGGEGRRENTGSSHGDEASDAGRGTQDNHIALGAGSQRVPAGERGAGVADADSESLGRPAIARGQCDQWLSEPDVGRVADGVPARVDRLRALGNALVPQIAEWIGRRIIEWEGGVR